MLPLYVGCYISVHRAQGLEYEHVMVDVYKMDKVWTAAMINTAVTRAIGKPGEPVNLIILNISKGCNYVNRSILDWFERSAAATAAELEADERESNVPFATRQVAAFLASSLRHPEEAAAAAVAFSELGQVSASLRVAEILGAGVRNEGTLTDGRDRLAGRKRLRQVSAAAASGSLRDDESDADNGAGSGAESDLEVVDDVTGYTQREFQEYYADCSRVESDNDD
jgi:hypothetical protein